jgi:hypothetical protein
MRSQLECFLAPFQANVMVGPGSDAAKWMSLLRIFSTWHPVNQSSHRICLLFAKFWSTRSALCFAGRTTHRLLALRRVRDEQERCAEIAENALEVLGTKYTWLERTLQILKNELTMQL